MASNGIKIAFGGAAWLNNPVDEVKDWLKVIEGAGVTIIDTAQVYGASEELIGKAGASARFTVDTKLPGVWGQQPSTKDTVIELGKASLERLGTKNVDVLYMHAPDRRVPFKETLAGFNELYKQGAFKRLGLSNYSPEEVEDMVRIAKENNFVVPSVYQGNYSAVARRADDEIFPVIRKHGMSFYCYSPIAGGFLAKSKATLTEAGGRFDPNHPFAGVYNGMYNRASFLDALELWEKIAEHEKVSRPELAYRWVVYHSKMQGDSGDVVIVGARNPEQFNATIQAIKAGPLSQEAVKMIDEVWDTVKADAHLDNFQMTSGGR